MMHILSF